MGRIISCINITLDGIIDARHTIADAAFFEFIQNIMKESQTVAFGRNTFELFEPRWTSLLVDATAPEPRRRMAFALNKIDKVVFSKTLKTVNWNNTTIRSEFDAAYFNYYKQNGKGGLLTFGSAKLVASLTALNLIDDYYFFIQPVLSGSQTEKSLFSDVQLEESRTLRYVESKQLSSGVHIIHYERIS
jgi:dihydrofolate reductase